MKPPDFYKTIYIVFAISAVATWVGWMPNILFGMVSVIALGAFIHEWRSNIARSNARKAEEAMMIAQHAPEMRGMENDFVKQAAYSLKVLEQYNATASPVARALFAEKFQEEIKSWQDGHNGELAGPWLSIATLRQVEAAVRATEQEHSAQ
jgi:hypothetical protein